MPYLKQLGLPCWTPEQVPKVISLTAQTSAASASYFLAAHSPFRKITDAKSSGHTLSEEEVFKEIFSKARGQVQAFVKGEPGTGKSHLIRWLKLRSDYAAHQKEDGLERFKLVLVTRGNGSLKDALGQIVHQLGKEFEQHLAQVRGAIDRLSDATARATLLAELALELDSRWTNERGRPALDRKLLHLGQSLRANGVGRWLKRDGGVIHQVIQRLTEQSTVEQRESPLLFSPEDFDVPAAYLSPSENPGQVIEFAEDLKEEQDTREVVARTVNIALDHAIGGLTGLKGSDLLEVFTEIRRQLGPKRSLALFIEDVSVTGLDQDVVNAFEPRDAAGLCRMVAVLGITTNAWDSPRMPDNLKQRATHIYEVGGETVNQWVANADDVTKFTARYLNAVRLGEDEIHEIAQERFDGDIRRSHCEKCNLRVQCHEVFGKVDFGGGVVVGMFPFSKTAPQAMLQGLSEARYKSQRGLLDRILLPALDQSFKTLSNQEFPRPQVFAVQTPAFPVWTGFLNRFCNGARWNDDRKSRLRFLAQFWVRGGTAEELATALKPFLQPLGLPEFSSKVADKPPDMEGSGVGKAPTPPVPPPVSDPESDRLLALLDTWKAGQQLKEDNKFRDLLGDFFNKSIVWQDFRYIPIAEKKRLITGNKFPRIEDQVMRPGGTYFFDFKRSSETYDLLQSLLLFSRSPDKTWGFEHGELHKRALSRWLRKHRKRVINSVQPEPQAIAQKSLRSAVQFLALTTLVRDRKKLPENRAERITSVFGAVWQPSEKPVALSSELQAILSDLEQRHSTIREFVIQEVGSGQGDASPRDFIDPLPVLTLLDAFDAHIKFEPPPQEAELNFWSSRFVAVKSLRMGAFAAIPSHLDKERVAIDNAITAAREFIHTAGFDTSNFRNGLEACLAELIEVVGLQKGTQHKRAILPMPNDTFDQLWQKKLIQNSDVRSSWATAINKALEVSVGKDPACLVAFNPAKLKECVDAFRIVEKHLDLVDKHMRDEESQKDAGGDSRSKLLGALKQIEDLSDPKEKSEPPA